MMWLGVVLLVAGAAGFWFAHRIRRDVHAMIAAETIPVAEIVNYQRAAAEVSPPGSFRRVSEVIGAATPGPQGMLTAELSKVECVWHRHVVHRRYQKVSYDTNRRRSVSEERDKVADFTSNALLGITDNTGFIQVDPNAATIDGAELIVDRFEPRANQAATSFFGISFDFSSDDTIGYDYQEWIIRPGSQLFVHGEVSDRIGQLTFVKPEAGPYVISTRSEEQFRKGRSLHQKGFAFGGAAGVLIGIALIVIALF